MSLMYLTYFYAARLADNPHYVPDVPNIPSTSPCQLVHSTTSALYILRLIHTTSLLYLTYFYAARLADNPHYVPDVPNIPSTSPCQLHHSTTSAICVLRLNLTDDPHYVVANFLLSMRGDVLMKY